MTQIDTGGAVEGNSKNNSRPTAPIIRPAVVAGPQAQRFTDFFSSLGLKYFRAKEFAFLGVAHNDPSIEEPHRNALPDEGLWPSIIPTARVLDRLRTDLMAPVRLTSVYRTEGYNSSGSIRNSVYGA